MDAVTNIKTLPGKTYSHNMFLPCNCIYVKLSLKHLVSRNLDLNSFVLIFQGKPHNNWNILWHTTTVTALDLRQKVIRSHLFCPGSFPSIIQPLVFVTCFPLFPFSSKSQVTPTPTSKWGRENKGNSELLPISKNYWADRSYSGPERFESTRRTRQNNPNVPKWRTVTFRAKVNFHFWRR